MTGMPWLTVIDAVALMLASVTLTASMFTLPPVGTVAGAK